jgi:hypothetical protein
MDEDMLLGADFFLSHRIYVANGQEKIYFTYNGGPVFALNPRGAAAKTAATKPSASPPDAAPLGVAASDDASEIGRRGAAELGRLEYGAAITDLTRARRPMCRTVRRAWRLRTSAMRCSLIPTMPTPWWPEPN